MFILNAKSAVTGLVLVLAFAFCAWAEDFVVFTGQVNAEKSTCARDATVMVQGICALKKRGFGGSGFRGLRLVHGYIAGRSAFLYKQGFCPVY
jgi:hypothetical protein